jgi:hypothetical protein
MPLWPTLAACGNLSAQVLQKETAMNTTKTLICILTAGAAFGAAAPVFADSGHYRGHDSDRGRYSYYDRQDHRGFNWARGYYRNYDRRHVVLVRQPYFVGRPAYYPAPVYYSAPVSDVAVGAIIGAAIGGLIVSQY